MTTDRILSTSELALEAFQYLEKCEIYTSTNPQTIIDNKSKNVPYQLKGKISKKNFIHYFNNYGSKTNVKDVEMMLFESCVVDSDNMVDYVKFVEYAKQK